MPNEIYSFDSPDFGEVRTLLIRSEPWFVASDVCRALEIGNSRMALSRLDEDEKAVTVVDTRGGPQKVNIISEAGLYSVVLTSRKANAKAFKRWMMHEVIPSIRKHGVYFSGSLLDQLEAHPDLLTGLVEQYKAEKKKAALIAAELEESRSALEQSRSELEQSRADLHQTSIRLEQSLADLAQSRTALEASFVKNAALTPKAGYYDSFVSQDDLTTFRYTAKELGVPQKKFIEYLLVHGYVFRDRHREGRVFVKAGKRNDPLFMTKDFYQRNGQKSEYTLVTPAGKAYFKAIADVIRSWEPGEDKGERSTEDAVLVSEENQPSLFDRQN